MPLKYILNEEQLSVTADIQIDICDSVCKKGLIAFSLTCTWEFVTLLGIILKISPLTVYS